MEPHRLSEILWRERHAADELLYRLEVERMVLSGGDDRWAGFAAEDVDRAVAALQAIERERSAEATTLAAHLGLPAVATLREMSEALSEPWRYVFDDHHRALTDSVAEADRQRLVNERLLTEGHEKAGAAPASGQPLDDRPGDVGRNGQRGGGGR